MHAPGDLILALDQQIHRQRKVKIGMIPTDQLQRITFSAITQHDEHINVARTHLVATRDGTEQENRNDLRMGFAYPDCDGSQSLEDLIPVDGDCLFECPRLRVLDPAPPGRADLSNDSWLTRLLR